MEIESIVSDSLVIITFLMENILFGHTNNLVSFYVPEIMHAGTYCATILSVVN